MKSDPSPEIERELFEYALVVHVESRLLGALSIHDPPKDADACWVHSSEMVESDLDPSREYWVRLQCYAQQGERHWADVKLWTMFCKVGIDNEDHPLVHFFMEVQTGRWNKTRMSPRS